MYDLTPFTGYDSAFLQGALNHPKVRSPSILPCSTQRLKSLSFNNFVFRDSLAHLSGSLAGLAADLKKSGHCWDIIRRSQLVRTEKNEEVVNDEHNNDASNTVVVQQPHTDLAYVYIAPELVKLAATKKKATSVEQQTEEDADARATPTPAAGSHSQTLLPPLIDVMCGDVDETKVQLLTQKGYYPYRVGVTKDQVESIKSLPPAVDFADDLNTVGGRGEAGLTEEEHRHAQHVWTTFGCANLMAYSLLYLRTDVLLLSEIFTAYRDESLAGFGLDPACYLGTPSYSFASCLKMTEVQLELIKNKEMYHKLEASIVGGSAFTTLRYAKHEPSLYPGGRMTKLLYIDANR